MKTRSGFSLLELSLVLMVIGVLVGAIAASETLIRGSKVRNVLMEFDQYAKAIQEFQQKYGALPGDFATAETLWGSDSSCPNTASNTTAKRATCNGDGSGTIGTVTASAGYVNSATSMYEYFRAWQHLANAGLIDGYFTGVKGSGSSYEAKVGVNVPQSKLADNAGWFLMYYVQNSSAPADAFLASGEYGHLLFLGGQQSFVYPNQPVLTPYEAYSIDKKIDDGLPLSGVVRHPYNITSDPSVSEASCATSTAYLTTDSTYYCHPLFVLGF